MAEIKKAEKSRPKYPIAAKIGAAALAVGVMAGCMTGCDGKVEPPDIVGNEVETIELDGSIAEYVEPDEADATPTDIN